MDLAKTTEYMTYDYLAGLRSRNAAWRLLAADQASFIAAFFYREFLAENRRAVEEQQLLSDLEDFIYDLRRAEDEVSFIRPAREYLDTWSDPQHAWLRRFYARSDEVCYDLTASAQKAVEWLYSLRKQSFVGTESRLRTVFDLLHEIARETDPDKEKRRVWLVAQRERLDQEIAAIDGGQEIRVMDAVQVKERFLHAASTAQSILADFREVEENFRALEQRLLERIVTWKQGKGELLEQFFADRDIIEESEQGKSFAAFWKYLMASSNREDFSRTMEQVMEVKDLSASEAAADFRHIDREWARAASAVQSTIIQLSRQIRRYVDENYLQEERSIYGLISQLEEKALQVRDKVPQGPFMELDGISPRVELPLDRPLFVPPRRPQLENQLLEAGASEGSVEALFNQVYVDKERLRRNIRQLLRDKPGVTLAEVLEAYPLQQGLTELLTYMVLASHENRGFLEGTVEKLLLAQQDGHRLLAIGEQVVFQRGEI